MRRFAPLLTLLAVAVLGGALLTLNVLGDPANRTARPTAAAGSEPAAAAAQTPAPAPPPTSAPPAAGEAPAVAEKAYAGRSAGNEVTVAIAVKNGRAVGYVCDGKKIEAWLEGTVSGDTLSLSGKTSSLTGTLDDKATFGTITVDGKEWPFSAKGVSSTAGLYEGRGVLRGVAARVGWIVDENGNVTGGARVGDEQQPAPPLPNPAPGTLPVDGGTLTVTALNGDAVVISR